jgi:hypothetical protein
MEKWLQGRLCEPGKIDKLSMHEGCHLFYFRQIHATAKYVPPCIRYSDSGQPEPIESAVDVKGIGRKCDEFRLSIFAKAAVSGGVIEVAQRLKVGESAETILKNSNEIGDHDDRDDFKKTCEEIRAASPDLKPFDSEVLWDTSRIGVAIDLNDPVVRLMIDAHIDQVRGELTASIYPTPESTWSHPDS